MPSPRPIGTRKLAVFDLDGTLADTAPDIMATLNVLLSREGLPALPVSAARTLVGAGARALLQRGFAAAGAPLSAERLDTLFEDFLIHYAENIAHGSTLFPGVLPALEALSGAGWHFAICTNKPERHSKLLIEALGVAAHFPTIAGRDTFPFNKPDPRHLTETIAAAGGETSRAVMVGDSHTDVATARAAGIPVVGVTFGYTDTPMAELAPDIVIDHFDALPGALAMVTRA